MIAWGQTFIEAVATGRGTIIVRARDLTHTGVMGEIEVIGHEGTAAHFPDNARTALRRLDDVRVSMQLERDRLER